MIWNFQGYCIEEKARGISKDYIKKEVDFTRVIKKKWSGVSRVLALGFQRSFTKFCRISRGEALGFFLEFPGVIFFLLNNPRWSHTVPKSKIESKFVVN